MERPLSETARQNDAETQETLINPDGPTLERVVHCEPSYVNIFPFQLTATQYEVVAHDTSSTRSLISPVETVFCEDHE
jgi:hypothetical protein